MRLRDLTREDEDIIRKIYSETPSREEAQNILSKKYNVTTRTIRNWVRELEIVGNPTVGAKVLIYDIETSMITAEVWWTGKQYISHSQLKDEPKIISIAWKWVGEDEVKTLHWHLGNQSDEGMLEKFLKEYNKADLIVGVNNDRFDNRWINARSAKFGLKVNLYVNSFDVQRQMKRFFRLPSYAMKYVAKYFGLELKGEHVGIEMWRKIQYGTPDEQKEYLAMMLDYNRQDIVVTEDIYLKLRQYMGNKIHVGVMNGEPKWTCPHCGGSSIKLDKTNVTPAGTVQRIMRCIDDGVQFKVSNKTYVEFLDYKVDENI